jgi:UDP-3-O-[3-hydroxymyristoyl] glucosamine N-acyltransferase
MDNEVMEILEVTQGYDRTCSLTSPVSKAVTYAKDESYFGLLTKITHDVIVMVPKSSAAQIGNRSVRLLPVEDVMLMFTIYHNHVNEQRSPALDRVSPQAVIHDSAVIGIDGVRLVKDRYGRKIPFKHMGNVVIKAGVQIGPCSVIHRGCFDSTIIQENVIIGSLCNVGHNCFLDHGVLLTAGVIIGGSVTLGKNCWVGMGAVIRNKVTVTDNVFIGANALVTKDLTEPGVYVGSPARWIRSWDGTWET